MELGPGPGRPAQPPPPAQRKTERMTAGEEGAWAAAGSARGRPVYASVSAPPPPAAPPCAGTAAVATGGGARSSLRIRGADSGTLALRSPRI